jgi:hypothetical protein
VVISRENVYLSPSVLQYGFNMIHTQLFAALRLSPISSNRSLILADDVPTMQDSRNPTQDGETDVDEKVGTAAAFEEHGDRWEEET